MVKKIQAHISINQFAEFSMATKAGKARIVKQQIQVNKTLINWYQSAKGGIRRYLKNVNDLTPLQDQIARLQNKSVITKHQRIDKDVSILALKRMIEMNLSKFIGNIKYEVVKSEVKSININNLQIAISPEVIIKVIIDGKIMYGGVKIHIGKTKPFNLEQCNYVAILLHDFLQSIKNEGEEVLPQFCLCIDVFGNRIVSAKGIHTEESRLINALCHEIIDLWDNAA